MPKRPNAKNFTSKFKRGRFGRAAKKAKKTVQKTTEQATDTFRSISDQVAGTKEHEREEFEAPRITTETVAEHREKVLSEARRFIYPLQTRRRIVAISISIVLGLILATIVLAAILLYRFDSTNGFVYNVSKFVPFPVAKVDGEFVPFKNYLFETRHTLHYLRHFGQEGVEIDSEEGKELASETKKRVLANVMRDEVAYQLAEEHDISVSSAEVEAQIERFTITGGIDQSEGTLESIIAKYYNWDLDDLRRVIRTQLIFKKLLPVLDKAANKELAAVEKRLADGDSFASVATRSSDDPATAERRGKLGEVTRDDSSLSPDAIDAIFALKRGGVSAPIVETNGYYLYRVDAIIDEDRREVSQILIRFFNIDNYLAERLDKLPHRAYIRP